MEVQPNDAETTAGALMSYGLAECRHCTRIVPLADLRCDSAQQGMLRCRDVVDCETARAAAIRFGRITEPPARKKPAHSHK